MQTVGRVNRRQRLHADRGTVDNSREAMSYCVSVYSNFLIISDNIAMRLLLAGSGRRTLNYVSIE